MRIEAGLIRRIGAFELDVAFASDAGITALFGRSGCGKTTILNFIAGLSRPDRGRIALGDRVLFDSARGIDVPAPERRIGYVFQDGLLLPHLSVRQNLVYGRFFTPHAERWAKFDAIVGLLGLEPLLARRPHRLSGGERQRVAIGRALLASPRLLLMDEPLASLDTPRKAEILYYIEYLRDELRIPLVYVSHAIEEVVRLADRLIVISAGKALAAGTVTELSARPELRPFLGRHEGGAIIETRVVDQDLANGLARLEFAGGTLYAPDVDALPGERLRVRIRARDVSLALSAPRDASFLNILSGTVSAIEDHPGASVDVSVDLNGTIVLARITKKSLAALGLAPGKPVYVLVKSVAIDRHSVGFA
ncbi:MAG: molybdenum ABC transporter ATP-binding protein [Burkholderiales bacterium]